MKKSLGISVSLVAGSIVVERWEDTGTRRLRYRIPLSFQIKPLCSVPLDCFLTVPRTGAGGVLGAPAHPRFGSEGSKHRTDRRTELLGLMSNGNCARVVAAHCGAHVYQPHRWGLGKSRFCGGLGSRWGGSERME